MARPLKNTNEQIIAALEATKGMIFLAAKRLRCKPDTITARARSTPAIARCLASERGKVVDTAELKLLAAIMDGQAWAISLMLKTQGKPEPTRLLSLFRGKGIGYKGGKAAGQGRDAFAVEE